MAMLSLAHEWAQATGTQLWILTIDHSLRDESAAEAQTVAGICAKLGHPHATARWQWDGKGNVQAQAREARLGLIDRWRGRLSHILMAHTRDDVAETFLMRLNRGAGVQGLSAMRADRPVAPQPAVPGDIIGDMPPESDSDATPAQGRSAFHILRPCLELRRDALRAYLRQVEQEWVDDPSNEDDRFERVRMRKLLSDWAAEGIGIDTLAATASRLARARPALEARAVGVWHQFGTLHTPSGEIHLSPDITDVEPETGLRLLSAALRFTSSVAYPPREAPLQGLWDQLQKGQGGTLHGCELRHEGPLIRIFREYAALAGMHTKAAYGHFWDHRWCVNSNAHAGQTLRALGEDGWAQIKDRSPGSPPFHSARSLPSLWNGDQLTWCGALGLGQMDQILLKPMQMTQLDFAEYLISH